MQDEPDFNPENRTAPSETNSQCKVCNSPDRREIEIALAQGISRELIAKRFSREGESFNRQNIHNHFHRHMQVIDQVVVEQAAARNRNRMLDVETAKSIDARNETMLDALRAQLEEQVASGLVRWTAKDMLAFMELDGQAIERRAAKQLELLMVEFHAFQDAVRWVVPRDLWPAIVDRCRESLRHKDHAPSDLVEGVNDDQEMETEEDAA